MNNTTITTKQADDIYNIVDRFDFEKCKAYMILKDWKVNGRIPEVKDLKEQAIRLLESVASDRYSTYKYNHNYGLLAIDPLRLFFYIENKNTIE